MHFSRSGATAKQVDEEEDRNRYPQRPEQDVASLAGLRALERGDRLLREEGGLDHGYFFVVTLSVVRVVVVEVVTSAEGVVVVVVDGVVVVVVALTLESGVVTMVVELGVVVVLDDVVVLGVTVVSRVVVVVVLAVWSRSQPETVKPAMSAREAARAVVDLKFMLPISFRG